VLNLDEDQEAADKPEEAAKKESTEKESAEAEA